MPSNPQLRSRRLFVFLGLALCLLLVLGCAGWWFWPKAVKTDIGFVVHYHGFDLVPSFEDTFWGRKPFAVEYWAIDPEHGKTIMEYCGDSPSPFRGFYPNGVLREEGLAIAEMTPEGPHPVSVTSGKYFKPDGQLGSEIINGTGTQTYWTPAGVMVLQIELDNGELVRRQRWFEDGTPSAIFERQDEAGAWRHVAYNRDGTIKEQGQYENGRRVGEWLVTDEDGKLVKQHY